jgi:outer membrane protein TolC
MRPIDKQTSNPPGDDFPPRRRGHRGQARTGLGLLAGLLLAVTAHSVAADGDDPLARYLAEALHDNALLHAQDYAVDAAQRGLDAARAQRAPQLALNARYTVAAGGRSFEIPAGDLVNPAYQTLNQLTAGTPGATSFPLIDNQQVNFLRRTEQDTRLSLTAPLYAPQLEAQVRVRAAELDGSVASREAYARTLVRDVKLAYYQLAQAEAGIAILEASRVALAENQRVAESLVAAGKATRDRVLRAAAETLAVEQRLDAARADARAARRYLNLLRNRPEDAPVEVVDTALTDTPMATPTGTRPELRSLESGIDAAGHAATLAAASLKPTVAFVADSGVQGTSYAIDRDSDVSTASLVLSWTLFDFGARRAAVSQARAEAARLSATRDDLARRLALAARSADDQAQTAERALITAEARVAAADEGFRIAERKRDAGQLSQVEFLDAERARTEARLGLAIARSQRLGAYAEQEYARATYPLPALRVSSATP